MEVLSGYLRAPHASEMELNSDRWSPGEVATGRRSGVEKLSD